MYVEGRLKTRQWQGEDGNTRYTTEIQVTDFTFLSNKGDGQSDNVRSEQNTQRTQQVESQTSPNPETGEDDDLPF